MVMAVAVIVLIAVNIIVLSITGSRGSSPGSAGRIAIFLLAPIQDAVAGSIRSIRGVWEHYFFLVSAAKENDALKKALNLAVERNNQCIEIELANSRIRKFFDFRKTKSEEVLAAEVIGKDPSSWFRTIIIDKGKAEGVKKGFPVVVPEGIAGQVVDVSSHYSKVLLIVDRNSAVDALVQRTRARGIIKGESVDRYIFNYVLRKNDVKVGDMVVSSGLDGVYPKGLRIGNVSEVIKRNSGIFQDVAVIPTVDFEKLEEVLIILKTHNDEFVKK